MNSIIDTLLTRRSVLAKSLTSPGPSEEELDKILASAHRVPDHGKIGPWRFIIFENEARSRFSEKIAKIFEIDNPQATEAQRSFEAERLTRAPLVIAVISSPQDHPKVPLWEQELSAGAVCQNILLAATGYGYGAQWLTEWYSFHKEVDTLLELKEAEKVAGFIYIGSFDEKPSERTRPSLEERVSRF